MELCAEPATNTQADRGKPHNGGDKSCLDPTNLKIRKIFRMSGKPHKASFARFPPGPSAADWFG
jgi:hypothetical protein